MKRKSLLLAAAALMLTVFMAAPLYAYSWSLNGWWGYTINVDSSDPEVSLYQDGYIYMDMDRQGDSEYFYSCDVDGQGTLRVNGKNYSYNFEQYDIDLRGEGEYIPGQTFTVDYTTTVNNKDARIYGTMRQTGENRITSDVTITYDGHTADGTIQADRDDYDDGSSGCNAGFGALALLALVPLAYRKKK